ncbi:MAG: hypothetical protein WCK49_09545 [Myxococcaceae bacterium]
MKIFAFLFVFGVSFSIQAQIELRQEKDQLEEELILSKSEAGRLQEIKNQLRIFSHNAFEKQLVRSGIIDFANILGGFSGISGASIFQMPASPVNNLPPMLSLPGSPGSAGSGGNRASAAASSAPSSLPVSSTPARKKYGNPVFQLKFLIVDAAEQPEKKQELLNYYKD